MKKDPPAVMLANICEIEVAEARKLLRQVTKQGATATAYLKAVNALSNHTGKSFMLCLRAWIHNPALLVGLTQFDRWQQIPFLTDQLARTEQLAEAIAKSQ